ncbi:hypothetical protein JAAARDRAFT_53451 [Jaapia argillacea MUCL 33604]|uniref:Dynamin N-terminal domain-containing protein n=1 Tax=Jaapia argillacea MUCL 33604 TaxID=933084 RepID=A0A067Q8B8_9AGAM|nr:hypothetical protein JAAARDRAFT_53451 [Jaapia argillacea MUCL 33604]
MDEPMPDTESDAPSELTAIVDDFDDRTRNFVNNVAKLFGLLDQPKVSLSEERRKIWKENLEEIVKPPEPCQIAIVGQTGCGKSSLLNAILDAPVAPASSSGRACTSVPTEFSFKDIPHFEAIIHFRDVEECKAELLALHADFSLSSDGSQHDSKSLMELGARLKAVRIPQESLESLDVDQILSQEGLKGILGQEEYISSSDPLELQKMLYQRMTGNGADVTGDPSSWSLAKKIQVFGKFPALSTGVTLVDVPGSGDANSVRNNVATEYLVKSDALILVVEQKRAIDNLDALEKLKMLIKRLFSDGRLADSSLSLVFTMADTPVDFHEVDQYTPYGDENTIRCLHEQITTVDRYKAEKQSCEKKLRAMRKNTTKAALELKKRIKDVCIAKLQCMEVLIMVSP